MRKRNMMQIAIEVFRVVGFIAALSVILALVIPRNAQASDTDCEAIADYAAAVMRARQEGVDVVRAYKSASREEMRTVVRWAYAKMRFSSTTYREEAISNFRVEVFFACQDGHL